MQETFKNYPNEWKEKALISSNQNMEKEAGVTYEI